MKFFVLITLLIFIVSCKKEIDQTGTLRVAGNSPFTQLVFTSENVDYQLPKEYQSIYEKHQNKKVRLKGEVSVREMTSGDGKYTIQIFSVEPDTIIILN